MQYFDTLNLKVCQGTRKKLPHVLRRKKTDISGSKGQFLLYKYYCRQGCVSACPQNSVTINICMLSLSMNIYVPVGLEHCKVSLNLVLFPLGRLTFSPISHIFNICFTPSSFCPAESWKSISYALLHFTNIQTYIKYVLSVYTLRYLSFCL